MCVPALLGRSTLATLATGLVLLGTACGLPSLGAGAMDHHVAEASTSLFDAGSMTRALQTTEAGGVETVTVRNPQDQAAIARARTYLQQEAAQFRQGQYADPAKQHGMEMPGSRDLEAGYGRVQVAYADLPTGGQVTYTAPDQPLVQAVHAWFERRQIGGL